MERPTLLQETGRHSNSPGAVATLFMYTRHTFLGRLRGIRDGVQLISNAAPKFVSLLEQNSNFCCLVWKGLHKLLSRASHSVLSFLGSVDFVAFDGFKS